MMQIDTSAAAFVAGIVTSVHCVGMCGPLSCSWAVGPKGGGFMQSTALYHGGRMVSYGAAGAVAGTLGAVPLAFFQHGAGMVLPWLLVLAFACVGLGLDAWLPKPHFLSAGLRRVQTAAFKMKSTWRAAILGLATPLLVNLVVQTLLVVLVARWVVPRVMGRDYDAAVMAGGFTGFMLGTTANAMAVMRTVTDQYGPAPRAFLVAPLVGAFFIDFANAVIITGFLNWR